MLKAVLPKPEAGLLLGVAFPNPTGLKLQAALPKLEGLLLLLLDATVPKLHSGIPKAGAELLEAASPNKPLLKAVLPKPEAGLLLGAALSSQSCG